MSSIHYKFRATLEYKTLQFDGLHITGADLKKEICSKEGIRAEAFDLLLQNAHTKRSYTAEELIPRNSSIIVQRVPREDAEKLPKIQGVNTGVVVRNTTTETGAVVPSHMNPEEFEKLSEEDQIAHIKDVSTAKYHSSNFQKKTTNIMSGPPPPTYTCNRCYQPGHWCKNCPMLATKRTTGIPSQELMETTAEDPLAMLHPSGKLVVPIMHWKARQHTKKIAEEGPAVERVPPPELTCPICSHLLKDAVLTTCCGNSFCADCISNKLMESPDRQCPGKNCDNKQVSVDALVPNKTVRQAAAAWSMGGSGLGNQDQEHMRFRIGLQPSVTVSAASTPPQTLPPQVSQAPLPVAPVPAPQQDSVQAQNSPTPFAAPPPVSVAVPSSFSQPPPIMVQGPVASSSSSGDSLLPPGTSSVPPPTMGLPMTSIHTASSLPPIPGVGLPIQHQLLVPANPTYIYNQPPPTINLGAPQPQIMDAWDAFLHRKDRERERPRKRARSRNRSSSSTPSSSSTDDRRKRRNRHERDKRRIHRSDKEKERDRGREGRYRHADERRDRDRERNRERDWSDRHRESRPSRTAPTANRREGKEESALPSLMGLDVATPPLLSTRRDRSRTRSNSPQNHQTALSSERKKRKKKDARWKSEASWRPRKPEKERRKENESEEAAREIADEEAIDGTLREVAEFVRVEANCDDDGIEFELEEMDPVKETATEAEDEKSVTDTEPVAEDTVDTVAAEPLSEADNEEPVEHRSESDAVDRKSESDATLLTKEDTTDKDKETVEEPVEENDERSSRKKDKKHKKHKKHKRSREGDDDGNESRHRHKRKKEKKEKKEKRKKEKKHRRDKDADQSDQGDSNKEEDHDELHSTRRDSVADEDTKLEKQVEYKEERRGSESNSQKKKEQRTHNEPERRGNEGKREDKRVDDKRHERSGKERENREGRRREKSRERAEKSRNRSRERTERKNKEHSSRKKEKDSGRDRETDEKHKDVDRKEDIRQKEKSDKNYKASQPHRSSDRIQESTSLRHVKEQSSIPQTSPATSRETVRDSLSQSKDDDNSSPSIRKHKGASSVQDSDEPSQKKQKQEPPAQSTGKVNPALASLVKFKVTPPGMKKSAALLKQVGVGDKESTDLEEDKSKGVADDDTSVDRRMREAFSPPKLQRKKITLNL
ncbi:hypothetical protein Y032_0103g3548 [Ancylostoma ceylanicum]|nr:hypothetical protein Y032_0103g3548 [Ancylostoma ceylanicum]